MKPTIIATAKAPPAIGPYSQAVVVKSSLLVFCAGQIALDPVSGTFVGEGDVRAQTTRVLENLRAVLEAAGSGLEQVIKTTVFLVDLKDFAVFNEVYGSYFSTSPPARATVEVAALPRGALVEIDAIAMAG